MPTTDLKLREAVYNDDHRPPPPTQFEIVQSTEFGGVRIPFIVLRGTLCGGDRAKTIDFSR